MKPYSENFRRPTTGFTLVELLVVITIVAVLAAVGVGGMLKYRKAADKTVTSNNVRQLQIANASYAADHSGNYVPVFSFNGERELNSHWKVNAEYLALLHGQDFVYKENGDENLNPPESFLDKIVVREKGSNWNQIAASYGINELQGASWGGENAKNGFKVVQVKNPARTFAFATATDWMAKYGAATEWTSRQPKGYDSSGMMAYRYDNKAIVVYFDGHVGLVSPDQVQKYIKDNGRDSAFWNGRSES